MTEPAPFDASVTPSVTLAGKQWPIPPLATRQLRKVRTPLYELNDRILKAGTTKVGDLLEIFTEAEFDRLIVDPVYYGLTRAHPQMTMDQFLDLEATVLELWVAVLVVQKQSGLFVARPASAAPITDETEDAPLGEVSAGETTSNTST